MVPSKKVTIMSVVAWEVPPALHRRIDATENIMAQCQTRERLAGR